MGQEIIVHVLVFINVTTLTQMEFTTVIDWTSPFPFYGFLGGVVFFIFIQMPIAHHISK